MEELSSLPIIKPWVEQGMLKLIHWDLFEEHTGMPLWDQRHVYNHAVLSHQGQRTLLFMPDIDEYVS
jgi:hypothetical protein